MEKLISKIAAILLFILASAITVTIVEYNPEDIRIGETFIPPPREVANLVGPFGAWLSTKLIHYTGISSFFIPVILLLWSVLRWLRVELKKFVSLTLIFIGWYFAVVIVASLPLFPVKYLTGELGLSISNVLQHLGSFGRYFFVFAFFLLWIMIMTPLGFRRPVKWTRSVIKNIYEFWTGFFRRRKQRKLEERQKILEDYQRRQERLHRRLAETRTGTLEHKIPVEEIVAPKENGKKVISIDEGAPVGVADTEFTPPPIISKNTTTSKETTGEPPVAIERPFSVKPISEEIIVPPKFDRKGFQPQQQEITQPSKDQHIVENSLVSESAQRVSSQNIEEQEMSEIDEDNLPAWLLKLPVESAQVGKGVELDAGKTAADEEVSPDLEESEDLVSEDVGESTELSLKPTPFSQPPTTILQEPVRIERKLSEVELQTIARKLFQALQTYKVEGKVVAITPGPVITRYEFEPAPGTKVSRVASLADDLALALKAQDVRVVAPLPGKGTIGIEIPNPETQVVYIREILESQTFKNARGPLPLALGKDVTGEPVITSLAKMPHLLIAGATGSGKSVCINAILTSLIYKHSPTELRLLLIDPKRLELSIYDGIPYLVSSVIVEPKEAVASLGWALGLMEERYRKLAQAHVRSLLEYNSAIARNAFIGESLPYIVIIIDELADLMLTVGNEIEEPIARIAQMARAVGIHLIVATQRPSVDVVTGTIKANFPSRIAFKVRSKIDSRTILDMAGAERLLGQGDMLYLPTGFAEPIRIHGSYISTPESEALVDYLKQFRNPQAELLSFKEEIQKRAGSAEQDELFWEAAKIVVISQKGSASHLQRKLRIGYTRAASIIDQLEMAGIIGPYEGSKAREVLVKTLEELDELRRKIENPE